MISCWRSCDGSCWQGAPGGRRLSRRRCERVAGWWRRRSFACQWSTGRLARFPYAGRSRWRMLSSGRGWLVCASWPPFARLDQFSMGRTWVERGSRQSGRRLRPERVVSGYHGRTLENDSRDVHTLGMVGGPPVKITPLPQRPTGSAGTSGRRQPPGVPRPPLPGAR